MTRDINTYHTILDNFKDMTDMRFRVAKRSPRGAMAAYNSVAIQVPVEQTVESHSDV